MSIALNFLSTAARLPDKEFLVSPEGRRFSYDDVRRRSLGFAAHLRAKGLGPEDRLLLTFPNSVDYLCAYLGTLLNGSTAVLVDHRSRAEHLDFVRTNSGSAGWVGSDALTHFDGIPDRLDVPAELTDAGDFEVDAEELRRNPLALVLYTSGSTGTPKGVRLTHDNLQHTIRAITGWAGIDESDRELTTLSLTHLFGLAHVHIYWSLGGTVLLEDRLQNVPELMQRVSREGVTSFPGTPGGFKLILDEYADLFAEHCRGLKYIIVNSAPMAPEYVRKVLELLPDTRFYMYYGLTEASRSTYICYNDHPDKITSVGRASPGAEVRVGSAEVSLVDEVGEILIRGPHVTDGYLSADSASSFEDGWLKTGDLGIADSEGFITWRGRLKEQINVNGLKLSPREVEQVMLDHPRVLDAVAVGVPDETSGESVVGFVVVDGASDRALGIDIRKFCNGRLEPFKVPRRIVFVDEIPRTDSGKTKRLHLKRSLE